MGTVEVLTTARELISDPARWTRFAIARDENGKSSMDARSSEMVAFCAYGALVRASAGDLSACGSAANYLDEACPGGDLIQFNNGPKHQGADQPVRPAPARHRKVLAAFDKAVALAEKEAA